MCESWYIYSHSLTPWRRHGEKQECDRRGRTREKSSVSSLLVFIASFVCTVAERQKMQRAFCAEERPRGGDVGGRRVSPEVHFNCSEAKKMKEKKTGAGKQQWPPAVSGSVGEVAEIGIQPSSLIASPYLLLFSSNSPLLL